MAGRIGKLMRSALLAGLLATAATFGLNWVWTAIGGGAMSIHGWIALGLGLFGTVALAWLLMALAFRSDSEGWDDNVDTRNDPGRTRDEA